MMYLLRVLCTKLSIKISGENNTFDFLGHFKKFCHSTLFIPYSEFSTSQN